MRVTFDSNIAKKYDLSLVESILIYLIANKVNIEDSINNLLTKGIVDKDLFHDGNYIISNNIKELISAIIIESDKSIIDKEEEFIDLAKAIQEIYPKGRKSGTTYMWRGTTAEIARKLKTLVVKYKFSFTKEQAIEATKKYVQSFNGDYTKMRLLKYFILKNIKDADNNIDLVSDFMSLIENEGQDNINQNWTTNLL